MKKIDFLKKNSIHLPCSKIKAITREKEETVIDIEKLKEYPECYSIKSSIMCFVTDKREVYVTPYTWFAISVLIECGYTEKTFDVPFSNGERPKNHAEFWDGLLDKARSAQYAGMSMIGL